VEFVERPPAEAPKRRRRRSRPVVPQKRISRTFIGAIAGIVLALGIFGAITWQRLQYFDSKTDSDRYVSVQPATEVSASEAERPVFRYSVVPGGVRSPQELADAMSRDAVVAEHYAGVDPTKMRIERLREPMQAHVSYRIADRVYWTSRKITLQAGEQVLTDGQRIVRGRCGNSVSVDPLLPTLDSEPRPAALDSIVNPVSASRQGLDPAMSYLAQPNLTSSSLMPGRGATTFGGSAPGMTLPGTVTAGVPPSGGTGPAVTEHGLTPPVMPPGNPPDHPTDPPDNPPGGDPPGIDPHGNPPGDPPPDPTPPTAPTPVPEPGTLLLVAAGAAALLARHLKKQSQ
jgi:hypothetical protein